MAAKRIQYRSLQTLSKHLNLRFFMQQKWTMEHVVPRSFMKHSSRYKSLVKDGHNIILYPSQLNSHRSNFRIVSDMEIDPLHPKSIPLDLNGNQIQSEEEFSKEEWFGRVSWKNTEECVFSPAMIFRGEIARACLYMNATYKELEDNGSVFPNTMDPNLAVKWDHVFQMTHWERKKRLLVNQLQFVDDDE